VQCSYSVCLKKREDNQRAVEEFADRWRARGFTDRFECFYDTVDPSRVIVEKMYTINDVIHSMTWPSLVVVICGLVFLRHRTRRVVNLSQNRLRIVIELSQTCLTAAEFAVSLIYRRTVAELLHVCFTMSWNSLRCQLVVKLFQNRLKIVTELSQTCLSSSADSSSQADSVWPPKHVGVAADFHEAATASAPPAAAAAWRAGTIQRRSSRRRQASENNRLRPRRRRHY